MKTLYKIKILEILIMINLQITTKFSDNIIAQCFELILINFQFNCKYDECLKI